MNGDLYDRMLAQLKLAGYQERSWKSYLRAVRQLQNFHSKDLEDITEEDIQNYWVYCKDELEWRPSTMRISYSGIKFFFVNTLKRDWDTLRLIKVEAEKRLPTILSIDEVRTILASIHTPQNKAFFTLVYSCGLRLQEAIHPGGRSRRRAGADACPAWQGRERPLRAHAGSDIAHPSRLLENAQEPHMAVSGPWTHG